MLRRSHVIAAAAVARISSRGLQNLAKNTTLYCGQVVAKSSDQLTVNQQDIPGFMAPMTMRSSRAVRDTEALGEDSAWG